MARIAVSEVEIDGVKISAEKVLQALSALHAKHNPSLSLNPVEGGDRIVGVRLVKKEATDLMQFVASTRWGPGSATLPTIDLD